LRMASSCYICILERAGFECELLSLPEDRRLELVEGLLQFMAEHMRDVPATVGTEREIMLKRISGVADPYSKLKEESNDVARELLPVAERFYDLSEDKMEALVRIAAAANSMEFGVRGHEFDNRSFSSVFEDTLREDLVGDLDALKKLLARSSRIFYLTDNAGEVVFDLFVMEKLREMGKRVIIGPKAEPVLNDVTADELEGMTDAEIVPTGGVVGISLDRINPEARRLLFDPEWLVIAKGMGNFETISEFEEALRGRLIYIFRAKCEPVARANCVRQGSLVARAYL